MARIASTITNKSGIYILGIMLLISCRNAKYHTGDRVRIEGRLTDSSREKLIGMLDTVIASNASPDDTTISARFISQGKRENGDSYITLKTENDSLVVLIDPMPYSDEEIAKFKKDGNNITVTYSAPDKKVKFIAADYEQQK